MVADADGGPHQPENGDEFELDGGGRGGQLDHLGDLAAGVDGEGARLGGEAGGGDDGGVQLLRVVRVEAVAHAVVDGAPLGDDGRHGAQRPQRQRPRHWIVRVHHREDALHELVHVQDLVQVLLALPAHPQHAQAREIRPVATTISLKITTEVKRFPCSKHDLKMVVFFSHLEALRKHT